YDVVQTGPRTLKLTMIDESDLGDDDGEESPWLEVELDERFRVIALRVRQGEHMLSTTGFEWTDAGLVLDSGRTLKRVGAAQPIANQPQATRVDLPLPSPADPQPELAAHSPHSSESITLQQHRRAGNAALGQLAETATILAELADRAGRVLPGELVLGGAALSQAPPTVREAVLDAAEPGLVRDYLQAGLQALDGRIVALRKLADRDDLLGTPIGFWASYRTLLYEAGRSPGEPGLRRLEQFLEHYRHPAFALVATIQMTHHWWAKQERKATAWLALAEQGNQWKYVALHQAGLAHYYRGRHDDAAELFERSFREAEADATVPIVDWSVHWALTQSLGEAGWELAWTQLRERVSKQKDPRLAIRFMVMAAQLNRPDDGQRVLDRLEPETMDPAVGVSVFDALI